MNTKNKEKAIEKKTPNIKINSEIGMLFFIYN